MLAKPRRLRNFASASTKNLDTLYFLRYLSQGWAAQHPDVFFLLIRKLWTDFGKRARSGKFRVREDCGSSTKTLERVSPKRKENLIQRSWGEKI